MLIAHQLPLGSNALKRGALEHLLIPLSDVGEHLRLKDHIARIDRRGILHRLLTEGTHGIIHLDREDPFLLLLHHSRQRSDLPMRAMKLNQLCDIDIADAVAVGHHEGLIADVFPDPPNTRAGHRMEAGIHDRNPPRLRMLIVNDGAAALRKVKCDIRRVEEVVGKPLLDHVLLITCTDDELIETIVAVFLHDVPENRHAPDLDHRLRAQLGLLRNARPPSPGEQYHFHRMSSR